MKKSALGFLLMLAASLSCSHKDRILPTAGPRSLVPGIPRLVSQADAVFKGEVIDTQRVGTFEHTLDSGESVDVNVMSARLRVDRTLKGPAPSSGEVSIISYLPGAPLGWEPLRAETYGLFFAVSKPEGYVIADLVHPWFPVSRRAHALKGLQRVLDEFVLSDRPLLVRPAMPDESRPGPRGPAARGLRPRDVNAGRALGLMVAILEQDGEIKTAVALCDSAMRAHPESEGIGKAGTTRMTSLLIRSGQPDRAAEMLAKLMAQYPEAAVASWSQYAMGNVLKHGGDIDRAIAAHEKAVGMAADTEAGMDACEAILGLCLAQPQSEYERAIERLCSITLGCQGTKAAHVAQFGIGQLYAELGMREQAETEWVKLLAEGSAVGEELVKRTQRGLARVRYDLALAANSAGDRMTSVRKMALVLKEPGYAESLKWDESLEGPLGLYALWCWDLGRHVSSEWFEEVIWAYNKLIELRPDEPGKLYYRAEAALCLQGLGRHRDAIAELQAILAAQPDDRELVEKCRKALQASEDAVAGHLPSRAPRGPSVAPVQAGPRQGE